VHYGIQGLDAKSEPLLKRALRIREKMLGPEHRLTASSLINLAANFYSQGQFAKFESLIRQGLGIEFILIQREAPFLPVAERQSFVNSYGNAYERAFSSAQRGSSGANLSLFSRLNRQGLLQEIEQRQAQLASLPGPQQALATELRAVTQQLASMALPPEQRQQLKGRQEELEKQLYRLLPQLQPRVVEVQQVAKALPAGSALIEFQRYRPFDGTKPENPDDQRWGQARYLALVLKPDGVITPIDLGLAKPIDTLIQSALEASEQKQADALALWAQVGRAVLNPLTSATGGVNTLFISPDGELNRIPFAALPAPSSRQLLSEALQIRLLTTGRELLDLQNTSSIKTSQALVVANPAFDRTPVSIQSPPLSISSQQRSGDLASQRWAPLPGTATEGAAIAQLTSGRLLAGEQARATAIQQQQSPRLLHLATHAYFQPDLPEAERKQDQPQRSNNNPSPMALSRENPLLRVC
jgi:CHAT domain-containing protein